MVVLVESDNEDSQGLLTCSECGASGYRNLITHLSRVHHMKPKDYLQKYPNDKVYTDECRANFSKGGYNANKAMIDKGTDFSERSRKARKTERENDPDAYLKRNRNLYKDPGFRERATKRIMSTSRWHRDRYHYNGLSFRSSWEVKFAEWLDSINIKYEYESIKVKYYDPSRKEYRYYYPDFYIPDYNLCVEIKPKCYVDNVTVKSKAEAVKSSGYNFIFITQDELSNLSTNLFNV